MALSVPAGSRLRAHRRLQRRGVLGLAGVCALVFLTGCGGDASPPAGAGTVGTAAQARAAAERAEAIQAAVQRWAGATSLPQAQSAAQLARDLVTGPTVEGATTTTQDSDAPKQGLLPGTDGSPGLATPLASGCVERDVLGGSWSDPQARWDAAAERIDAWTPQRNTFPGFPSHAQRVVGWATLTLRSSSLDAALEYSGHASLHAGIVRAALADPGASPCPG